LLKDIFLLTELYFAIFADTLECKNRSKEHTIRLKAVAIRKIAVKPKLARRAT